MPTEFYLQELENSTTHELRDLYTNTGPWIKHFDYKNVRIDPTYIEDVLLPFLVILPNKPKILDLGCGIGEEADELELHYAKTVRLDISKVALNLQGGTNRTQATLTSLPFKDGSFDAIHCKDSYSHVHIDLRMRFFSELRRVLKPEGIILLTFVENERTPDRQHATPLINLKRDALLNHLSVINEKTWTTSNHENDWYRLCVELRPRKVLTLQRKG